MSFKKVFLLICMFLPVLSMAQDFQRLKAKADSLKAIAYYEKALVYYDQALFYYRSNTEGKVDITPPATDQEWQETLIAKAEATYKAGKQVDVPDIYWSLRYFKNKDKEPPIPEALLHYKAIKPILKAKQFRRFKAEGDSLKRLAKNHTAVKAYDKALQQVLGYKELVNEYDWQAALYEASDTQDKLDKINNSGYHIINPKYTKLIQTLPQKVAELKRKGVNKIFSFNFYFTGGTGTMMITKMSYGNAGFQNASYVHLVWIDGDDLYMQAFSDKNIRPPLRMNAVGLIDLLMTHFDHMMIEDMHQQRRGADHQEDYVFDLYGKDNLIKEVKYRQSDITDPRPRAKERYFNPKDVAVYDANITSHLYQLQLLSTELRWDYDKRLNMEFK